MKPTLHPSTTRALGAPANWKQESLPVEALPITDHHVNGVPCIASFWQPDASELAVLNAGGLVMLNVVGRDMLPVSLTVTLAGTVHTREATVVKDDGALTQALQERDAAEGWADSLADLIGRYFDRDVGEHSSAHCPWQEAKTIIEGATKYKPASSDLSPGLEAAAKWVERVRSEFDAEHGHEDPETGAWEYGTGPHAQAKAEYSAELIEIADGIRAYAKQLDSTGGKS